MGAMANPSSSSSSAQFRSSKLTSVIVGRVECVGPTPPVVVLVAEPDFALSFLLLSSFPFFFFLGFVSSAAKAFWPAMYPGFCPPLFVLHPQLAAQHYKLYPKTYSCMYFIVIAGNTRKMLQSSSRYRACACPISLPRTEDSPSYDSTIQKTKHYIRIKLMDPWRPDCLQSGFSSRLAAQIECLAVAFYSRPVDPAPTERVKRGEIS